jgi:hypothetical protein
VFFLPPLVDLPSPSFEQLGYGYGLTLLPSFAFLTGQVVGMASSKAPFQKFTLFCLYVHTMFTWDVVLKSLELTKTKKNIKI